jgi:hypothetical protein
MARQWNERNQGCQNQQTRLQFMFDHINSIHSAGQLVALTRQDTG